MSKVNGTIVGVNGNMISVKFDDAVSQFQGGLALCVGCFLYFLAVFIGAG